ncbi:uncharacterized protein LOC131257511 isoform X1 [Magnolia sinica]|uniref:uncharacterized protein LOC131257511 isoform X1 n=1 Tax=Magnolia sinica TaxID=86752 RepID=UPI00265A75BA|nr:uncharacterized protein LOC131257511 isoform X1 [Magnolia sinica]
MFKCCRKVERMTDEVDIVGTGGDGTNTINISTGACILATASGAKIAKDSSVGVYLYLNMNKKLCCICMRCLQQVKQEYYLVKNKLESLFGHPEHIKNLILVGPDGFSSESDGKSEWLTTETFTFMSSGNPSFRFAKKALEAQPCFFLMV